MTVNGAGSWSSPIVISDSDDSEAFVELELERRISSPRDGMDVDYEDYRDSYGWPDTREQEYAYNEEPRWDDPPDPPFQGTLLATHASCRAFSTYDIIFLSRRAR